MPFSSFGLTLSEPISSALHKLVPDAQSVEQARMTYLFWDIYDVELIAPNAHYQRGEPFALKLTYLRELQGKDIAQRSVQEMQKQGFNSKPTLEKWLKQMQHIFPDVSDGFYLLGIVDANQYTHFYSSQGHLGSVNDPIFTEHFFNIWLGEKTSAPQIRDKLLNENGKDR